MLTHVILEHTRLGRYAFAIGSNPEAAVYAGIPVAFHTTAVYAIGGMLTGLAGMIEASRLMTGQPTAGNGYELQAIAAVVIGGGSLHGGEGSVVGTLIGAFIMGLLSNGSDLLGVSPYLQQAIIGGGDHPGGDGGRVAEAPHNIATDAGILGNFNLRRPPSMKDWKKIADARELHIPEADFARITPALDSLEKSFRPLVASIPATVEPAFVFDIALEENE